jgi:hypothetical protein
MSAKNDAGLEIFPNIVIFLPDSMRGDAGKEELYDLRNDPSELYNLIDRYANEEIKNDLKEQLLRCYMRTSDNSDWKRKRNI